MVMRFSISEALTKSINLLVHLTNSASSIIPNETLDKNGTECEISLVELYNNMPFTQLVN